ncbi:A/G-specific adenine glycosylase [bacterium]|nr:A/G-specific adenine glycosylase [bacterium]
MEQMNLYLLRWYHQNKRELPWRKDQNPYHIWISEIMLQQTRIEAVIGYYDRFIKRLPSIQDLAQINDDELLKLWEGLGYYTRARNLKKAAIMIMEEYDGIFPNTFEQIMSLPGIGEYTASAIGSICFSLKEVTIDGNVLRVYMRLQNCYDNVDDLKIRKKVRNELQKIMPEEAGDFNQALMELGETICLPNGIPKCSECPLKDFCKGYQNDTYLELPIKNKKKDKKEEEYTILLFYYKNQFVLEKRKESGLLQNLWQFPNIQGHFTKKQLENYLKENNIHFLKVKKSVSYTHIFTHKRWNMISYMVELDKNDYNMNWNDLKNLKEKAIPTAFKPFLKELKEVI